MQDPKRLFESAQNQIASGDLNAAEQLLRQAVELSDEPALYTAILASLLGLQGRHDESLEILKEALLEDPSNAHLLVATGMTMKEKREYARAEQCFRMALENAPDHAAGLQQLALILADRGDLDEAADLAVQAFGQLPHNPDLAITASDVLRLLGRDQEAFEIIEQTATYRPDDLITVEAAVEAALDLEHPDRAWQLIGKVQSTHPRVLTYKAVVLDQLGRREESEKFLEALQPHDRLPADLMLQVAGICLRREEYEHSLHLIETLLAVDDQDSGPWRLRGQLEMAMGNLAEAVEHFRRAYALRPTPDLASQLATALYSSERYDEGVELCEPVVKDHPDAEQVWLNLVLLYAAQNRPDEALAALANTDPRQVLEVLEGATLETPAELALVPALQEFLVNWEEDEEEEPAEAEGPRKPAVARPSARGRKNKKKKKKK